MIYYIYLAGHIENGLSMLPEVATWTFSSKLTYVLQNTYIKDKFLASSILYSHGAYKAAQK